MKVVFLQDVEGVANGGDVKEVKRGFARNYLVPKALAVPATKDALQRIERLTHQSDENRVKRIENLQALADELGGQRVDVAMRAGASGRLYGSVTNTNIAEQLSTLIDSEIGRRSVEIPEPIRDVGVYEVNIRLYSDISASVNVLVHPMDTDPDEYLQFLETRKQSEEDTDTGTGDELEAELATPMNTDQPVEDIGASGENEDEDTADSSNEVEADEETLSESSHTSPDEESVESTE